MTYFPSHHHHFTTLLHLRVSVSTLHCLRLLTELWVSEPAPALSVTSSRPTLWTTITSLRSYKAQPQLRNGNQFVLSYHITSDHFVLIFYDVWDCVSKCQSAALSWLQVRCGDSGSGARQTAAGARDSGHGHTGAYSMLRCSEWWFLIHRVYVLFPEWVDQSLSKYGLNIHPCRQIQSA